MMLNILTTEQKMLKTNDQIISDESLALSKMLHFLSEVNLADSHESKKMIWTHISSIAISCAIKYKKNENT